MTHKPYNIFEKHVPPAKSTMLGDLELTDEEFDALKKQIAHGLGQVQPDADASDELANAVGGIGSATNPVGCTSAPACIAYLKRLRTIDGHRIQSVRKGCIVNKAVSKFPIDAYDVIGTDDKLLTTLFMSGYQMSNTKLVPDGFSLTRSNTHCQDHLFSA